jgi:hypothetical protein
VAGGADGGVMGDFIDQDHLYEMITNCILSALKGLS